MFTVLDESYDHVIQSVSLTVMADYSYALESLVPLINKLEFQRSPLRKAFYSRLERDITNGCIMPFLTIAINKDIHTDDTPFYSCNTHEELLSLLKNAFVLDGIQRLNTLNRVSNDENFDSTRPIFLNILICGSMDRLLYRMVTLNNGQKPMTARHQIEVLANNMFDFGKFSILPITEKQTKNKGKSKATNTDKPTMSKDTLIKSYIAYISNSVNIDNQKIIESKMDELITDQIMDSDITTRKIQYSDVLNFISTCMQTPYLNTWFSIPNNIIGFSASASTSFNAIKDISPDELCASLEIFEEAFSSIDVSKIKLGMARRRMVDYFFANYEKFSDLDVNQLLDKISMEI
jgi:hypothetical protein